MHKQIEEENYNGRISRGGDKMEEEKIEEERRKERRERNLRNTRVELRAFCSDSKF